MSGVGPKNVYSDYTVMFQGSKVMLKLWLLRDPILKTSNQH